MKKRAIALILLLLMFYCAPRVFAWVHERPSEYTVIDEHVENAITDGSATVGVGVHVYQYFENHHYHGDYVHLNVVATANSRETISYNSYGDTYSWETVSNRLYLGDDQGISVYMGYPVRFYGGPLSAEYEYVWVCSNGFLCFNEESTDRYYSRSIPDTEGPNGFVAPFWKDLDPTRGGSITCGPVHHDSGHGNPDIYGFCVSWNNVQDKYGVPHSFQVIMEYALDDVKGDDAQSKIIFQYDSVALNDPDTTIGIENQRGTKGNSINLESGNDQSLIFLTNKIGYIGQLTIRVWKNDDEASTDMDTDPQKVRGHNVELEQDVPDTDRQFEIALNGGYTLLEMAGFFGEIGAIQTAGFFIGPILVVREICAYAAYLQKEAKLLETDSLTYVTAKAVETSDSPLSTVVDADLCDFVYWYFTDNNVRSHYLKVTAELVYFTVQGGSVESSATISTSVGLEFRVSNGGGACPTLFVWDGTEYVEEGFLDIHAESDVTVQHEIQNTLALKHGVYNLQLRELDNHTSHIDQVKLYAVDDEGEWHLCPLIYARHNDSYVTWELLFDDEKRIDLTPTQIVNLKFLRLFPYSETAYFIFEINGYNPKNGFPE